MPQTDAKAQILTVIIAARNEENFLPACLTALLAQDDPAVAVIVAANACTDRTVELSRARMPAFAARGWRLTVLDLATGGKLGALNAADALADDTGGGGPRVYLDADVICGPGLLGQLRRALAVDAPRYATGTLVVARAKSPVTRAYARIWTQLPFVRGGAVGAGLFAVNAPGRARWGVFPDIISDDTYARLQFSPEERIEVPATYRWPMVEGLGNLIRVRRRQDIGVTEVHRLYPDLAANDTRPRPGPGTLAGLALRAPVGFAVYLGVHVMVRLGARSPDWTRGR